MRTLQKYIASKQAYDFADDIVTPVLKECSEIYSLNGSLGFAKVY
jgi:hypothetical protein